MTIREHGRLLGIFFLIQAGLQVFGGIFAVLIYGGLGGAMLANSRREEEQVMGGVFLVLAFVVAGLILIFAGLNALAGWKLFKNKTGARIWGIVASCIALLGFPLGTALGVYGLWFFFGDAGRHYDAQAGDIGSNYPPPPPNNWR